MNAAYAPILYWYPGKRTPPPEMIAAMEARHGRPYAGIERNESPTSEGPQPGGVRGLLVAYGTRKPVVYCARTYRWYRTDHGGWIGARRGAAPAEFSRGPGGKPIVPGVAVELGDGHTWCIPVANPLVSTCTLPCAEVLIAGTWQLTPQDAYAHLSEMAIDIAAKYRACAIDGAAFAMEEAALRQYCADIIAINYDLSITEMSALHLFKPDTWRRILEAFIDWPSYLLIIAAEAAAMQEAGTAADPRPTWPAIPAASATSPGEPDTAPTTPPPSPTST